MSSDSIIVMQELPSSNESQFYKKLAVDLAAGMITGWVSVLTLQPLDMIKTTMQTSQKMHTISSCCKEIYSTKKLKGFYKGMLFPLLGSSFLSAIYFGSNEQFKALCCYFSKGEYERNSLPLWQVTVAGSCAGLATDMVSIPVEHVKIRLQTQRNQMYFGSIDCLNKILKSYGVSGIYKSGQLQFMRDFIGCGCYFTAYEVAKRWMKSRSPNGQMSQTQLFLSGLVAGMSFWPLCFPLDVIKTKMQSDCFVTPKFASIRDCAKQIYQEEGRGLRNFYKGFAISNLRAIPNSAISLFTFETVITFLSKSFNLTH